MMKRRAVNQLLLEAPTRLFTKKEETKTEMVFRDEVVVCLQKKNFYPFLGKVTSLIGIYYFSFLRPPLLPLQFPYNQSLQRIQIIAKVVSKIANAIRK